ncbi:MAG: hypothetical protein KatS3mg118_3384 [Paracoccaceae bacterium]|nr:MAG: hypothetical protein KatS3mg118_3384 [Paracoccaceae bacterium]
MSAEAARRIGLLSLRNLSTHLSRCGIHEFEDLIAGAFEAATIIAPRPGPASALRLRMRNRLARLGGLQGLVPSGLAASVPAGGFDLFFFYAALPRDLVALDAVPDWRRRAGRAICWLQELWIDDIPRAGRLLDILDRFDHVFCAMAATTPVLQERLSVPVSYLPWGVDTILFSPLPSPPERCIHVNNISRIAPRTHAALLDHARRRGWHYEFTSIRGGIFAHDTAEHRWLYAQRMKRSRYLISHMAKVAERQERGRQEEFGLRYIEGIAGGAILLGDVIDSPAFRAHLGWPDAVIPLPYDCAEAGEIIDALDAQPERIAAARRANMLNALTRHDHLHRWQAILDIAGLPPTAGMERRAGQLAGLAAMLEAAPAARPGAACAGGRHG